MNDQAIHDDLARQFDAGLAKVKYEMQKNLFEIDPLNQERLNGLSKVFNQRLIVFQHEFLEFLARTKGPLSCTTVEFDFEIRTDRRVAEMAAAIVAGGGSGVLLNLITVTSGWWIWTTTISAAAAIGAAVGVSAGVVTAGVGVVAGAAAGIAAAMLSRSKRRALIRKAILNKFDQEVAPQLRNWARTHMNAGQ